MQFNTSVIILRQVRRSIWISICLLAFSYCSFAQYNPAFDSAYRAAIAFTDPAERLTRLRPLIEKSYESSVFQTITFGKTLLQTATETRSDSNLLQAHIILGSAYERNREFEQGLSHSLKAISIAGTQKDYLRQINAFQVAAFTYSSMGLMTGDKADMEKAFYYCGQALEVSKEHDIKSEVPYILSTTADVFAMNAKYDTAISLYRRALASRKEAGQNGTLSTYANLAIALNLNKNYDAALAVYATADSIADLEHAGAYFKMKIASNRAILFGDMGRSQESELLAKEVLANAQQTGAMDVQVDMVDHLKKLYQKQGRFHEAVTYADTLAAIKERMLTVEKTGQVAEMQARYDAGVKDQQIIGQQLTIHQNKRQRMFLWGGILLLFAVGSAAYVGLRRSRQLNRKISMQQEQLIAQKAELQRINEMKDQLFSLIGHDVRVPLNSLMAYATLLDQQGELPPEKIKKYNTDLRQTLGYTTVLMENLLQFAKTQMKATKSYAQTISLSGVLDRTLMLLRPAIDQKDILLHTAFDEDVTAFADEDMTEVILRNLLSNAIKFSNTGGSITISIKPLDELNICCTVHDSGAGMKQELIALWNDESVPAPVRSTMGTQHEKGAGLGLMLSKTFAGIMGGHLLVKSEEGKGSAFSLVLPRRKPVTL